MIATDDLCKQCPYQTGRQRGGHHDQFTEQAPKDQ